MHVGFGSERDDAGLNNADIFIAGIGDAVGIEGDRGEKSIVSEIPEKGAEIEPIASDQEGAAIGRDDWIGVGGGAIADRAQERGVRSVPNVDDVLIGRREEEAAVG